MDPFLIAAGIGAIGKLFGGVTSFLSDKAEQQVDRQNAQQHLQEAGVAASQAIEQGDAVAARAAVATAANGGGFVGSGLGLITSLADTAMYNARVAAYRGRTQANADLYQAEVAKMKGRAALIGGILGAGSSVLGGMAQDAAG